jgi:hypothetical protein
LIKRHPLERLVLGVTEAFWRLFGFGDDTLRWDFRKFLAVLAWVVVLVACSAGTESGLGAFEYELTKYLDEFFGDGSHRRLLSEPPLTMIVAMMRHALKPTSIG